MRARGDLHAALLARRSISSDLEHDAAWRRSIRFWIGDFLPHLDEPRRTDAYDPVGCLTFIFLLALSGAAILFLVRWVQALIKTAA